MEEAKKEITLREITQTPKDKYEMFSYMWLLVFKFWICTFLIQITTDGG